ncbi:MAG TPA: FtsX-like permease family protein [Anaeromyxobacter sp.]
MTALWTKLRRDLWHARGQAVAIGVVVACAVATSVGSVATARALARSRDLYYAQSGMPDVFADAARVPAAVAGRLAAVPGVADLDTRAVGDARLSWRGGTARVRLISTAPDGGRLGRLDLRSGRLPGAGEAVISEGFASATGLASGARVSLTVNGRMEPVTVSGVVLSPEHVYAIPPGGLFPDDRAFGLVWMRREAVEDALDLEGAFDQVALRLARGASVPDVVEQVDRVLRPFGGLGAFGRDRLLSNRFLSDEIRQLDNMATVLPSIFLGVAVFLVAVALSRIVAAQRMQIGTLKALGYGDLAIGVHYAGFAAAVALAGAAVGVALGHAFGLYMSRMYTAFYRFPVLDYRADPRAMASAAGLALAASLAGAAGAVRRAVRLRPAEAMRPPAPGRYRPTLFERLGAGVLLSLPARMSLRGLARRPVRSLLGAVGIATAVAVLVTGSFFTDAMDFMIRLAFEEALRADATVTFTHVVARSAGDELARIPGVLAVEPTRDLAAILRNGQRSERVALAGTVPAATLSGVVGEDGRRITVPPSGLVISSRLAKLLRVRPGDAVQVEILEGRRAVGELAISATVNDVLGLGATASLATLRRLGREGDVITGAQLAVDPAARDAVARALDARPGVAGVSWRAETVRSFRGTIARTLLAFAAMLVGFAVAIAGGVVYSAVRTSFAERSRELATLRVIGFTRAEAWRVLVGEVALQLAVALPLGALLGYGLSALSSHAFESDLFRIPVVIARSTWLFGLGVTAAAALATSLVARRWIRRIELADALRSGE